AKGIESVTHRRKYSSIIRRQAIVPDPFGFSKAILRPYEKGSAAILRRCSGQRLRLPGPTQMIMQALRLPSASPGQGRGQRPGIEVTRVEATTGIGAGRRPVGIQIHPEQ